MTFREHWEVWHDEIDLGMRIDNFIFSHVGSAGTDKLVASEASIMYKFYAALPYPEAKASRSNVSSWTSCITFKLSIHILSYMVNVCGRFKGYM